MVYILLLFFPFFAQADGSSKDDALEASRLAFSLDRASNNSRKSCSSTSTGNGLNLEKTNEGSLVCVAEAPQGIPLGTRFVKFSFDSPDQMPESFRKFIPGDAFRRSKDGRWDIYFALPNDNKGSGLYGAIFSKKGDGDDFGATHGFKVGTGHDFDGIYMQGEFSSDLYTKQASKMYKDKSGQLHVQQFFTEENILKLMVDNKNKGRSTFYEAGVGIVELNREDVRGWLFSSGQQKGYHKLGKRFIPENIPRPGASEKGVFFEGAFGKLFEYMHSNGKCDLTGEVKIHGVKSTVNDADSISLNAKGDVYFQSGAESFGYTGGLEIESKYHETANSPSNSLTYGAGISKGDTSLALKVKSALGGARQNYVDYNLDSENTYTLELRHKLGQPRSIPQPREISEGSSNKDRSSQGLNFAKESALENSQRIQSQSIAEDFSLAIFGNFKPSQE